MTKKYYPFSNSSIRMLIKKNSNGDYSNGYYFSAKIQRMMYQTKILTTFFCKSKNNADFCSRNPVETTC